MLDSIVESRSGRSSPVTGWDQQAAASMPVTDAGQGVALETYDPVAAR